MSNNSSFNFLVYICMILTLLGTIINVLTLPLVAIFITRRFDPIYKPLFKGAMGLGCFWRGSWYATAMGGPKWMRRKGSIDDQIFKDFDLWSAAKPFERWLAAIHTYSGLIALIMGLIFGIGHALFWFRHTFF